MPDKKMDGNWFEADSGQLYFWPETPDDLEFEKAAARAHAVMLNTLDPLAFVPLLAETVRYSGQKVLKNLDGRKRVVKYLVEKMSAIEKDLPDMKLFAELGDWQGRPCVVVAQCEKERLLAVVIFTVKNKTVLKVDICTETPKPYMVTRSGLYPGAEMEPGAESGGHMTTANIIETLKSRSALKDAGKCPTCERDVSNYGREMFDDDQCYERFRLYGCCQPCQQLLFGDKI